jgi:hypothetical protein
VLLCAKTLEAKRALAADFAETTVARYAFVVFEPGPCRHVGRLPRGNIAGLNSIFQIQISYSACLSNTCLAQSVILLELNL